MNTISIEMVNNYAKIYDIEADFMFGESIVYYKSEIEEDGVLLDAWNEVNENVDKMTCIATCGDDDNVYACLTDGNNYAYLLQDEMGEFTLLGHIKNGGRH